MRAVLAALTFALFAATASAQASVSISFFHDSLAPHGRWVATSSYGSCWVPGGVAAGWAPYTDGQWAWTDYGWTWASSDSWGDIAYHYGTWVWSPPYGWVWVPGTVWAPSWVTWAYSDDYIGWAPVPVSFALGGGGYVGAPIVVSQSSYVFVPSRQFAGVPVASVRVPAAQTAAIYARSQRATAFPVQGGIVHNTGLPIARAERAVGHKIEVARAPERIQAHPIPQGGGKSLRVVAPASERAAAINRSGGAPNSHETRSATAESQARQQGKSKTEPAHERPATTESQARHEAQPKKQPVQAHPAPPEPQARHEAQPKKQPEESHARHEPQPKKEPPPEKPAVPPGQSSARKEHAPAPEAAPREPVTREAAAPPPHASQPKAAPHEAQRPEAKAQRANPHAEPQHAKPQHDEPGREN
ncbi:MAG TPA: DUF6600 domain-containing protein [Thermoanaerobaculia bacterium]|nr:DUF6600 domain-containing protein [Thermoanaerobaculia bacterium]